jgi:hypothetical protein
MDSKNLKILIEELARAKKTKLKNLKAITKIKNKNKELKKFFKDYSKIFGDLHW